MQLKIFDFLLDLIFPNRCGFCGNFIPWDKFACDACINKLEPTDNYFRKDDFGNFVLCTSVTEYSGIAKEGILNLKRNCGTNTAKFFLPNLVNSLECAGFLEEVDLITAVPMNNKRQNETGYNHAEIIAKLLAKKLDIAYNFKIIGKNKSTHRQHDLSRRERLTAVKGSYYLKNSFDVKGKTILLCDDIITTGATLSECSRILLNAGAEKVYCATIATTNLKEGSDFAGT